MPSRSRPRQSTIDKADFSFERIFVLDIAIAALFPRRVHNVRTNLSKGLGFSREDRDTNIRRIAFVADLLSRNGVCAITAAISPYRATRDEARALMGDRFVEIYVKASVEECARRDVKGLYEKAFRGEIREFTGVSDPYEEPLRPELVLDTERESPEESARKVIEVVDARAAVAA